MGNGHELDRELLSAYLDGALVGSSLQEAERLVATDQSAADYLESLRGIGQSLKGLPEAKLPRDFAQTVLARARTEALRMGLPADHPVLRSSASSIDSSASESSSSAVDSSTLLIPAELDHSSARPVPARGRSGWGLAVGLATAAAILALVVFRGKEEPASSQSLLSQVAPKVQDSANPVGGQMQLAPDNSSPFGSQLAQAELSSSDKSLNEADRGTDTVAVSRGAGALEALRNDLRAEEASAAIDMLMIVDTVLSEQAWREDRFSDILKRAGIANVKPIVVDKDVQGALEETRMTASAPADSASDVPSAAMVFLRARGKTIDSVIREMFADRADFRQTTFDLAMDKPFNLLHKSLRKLASQSSSGDQPTACVLTSTKHGLGDSSALAPEFVAGHRRGKAAAANAALLDPGSAALSQQMNPMVELLVVLRQESAESK